MSRGFRASEGAFKKPREFLERIQKEVASALSRVEELRRSGRSFDLDAAVNALERAQIKMFNYDAKRAVFSEGQADTKGLQAQMANRAGITMQEFGDANLSVALSGLFGLKDRTNAATSTEARKASFNEASKGKSSVSIDDIKRNWPSDTAMYRDKEKDGSFAKGAKLDDAYFRVATAAEDLIRNAQTNTPEQNAEFITGLYNEFRSYDVSPKDAGRMVIQAVFTALVRTDEIDAKGRTEYLKKGGYAV